MNRILRCDWLPEREGGAILPGPYTGFVPQGKFGVLSHITDKPSLFGQEGWILALFFFCVFMDRDEVHKQAWSTNYINKAEVTVHYITILTIYTTLLLSPEFAYITHSTTYQSNLGIKIIYKS